MKKLIRAYNVDSNDIEELFAPEPIGTHWVCGIEGNVYAYLRKLKSDLMQIGYSDAVTKVQSICFLEKKDTILVGFGLL